jgi:hypothetical protein
MPAPKSLFVIAPIAAAVVACASAPPPTAELTRARTLIQQAADNGAPRYAEADLSRARAHLNDARAAADRGDRELAIFRANEAAADAQLALARADSAQAEKSAQEVQAGVDALRRETLRGPPTEIAQGE